MKIAFFALLALGSVTFANAASVGDSSTYDLTITNGGAVTHLVGVEKIITIADGNATIEQTVSYGGTVVSTQSAQTPLAQLEQYNFIVDNCQAIADSGQLPAGTTVKPETITVPAGTFQTCHVVSENQDSYLGHVPMGLVKFSGKAEDGSDVTQVLTAYTQQ